MADDIVRGDFETASAVDIKLGLARYFACPEFEVLCFCYRLPGAAEVSRWRPGMPPPQGLLDHVVSGGLFGGWNVMFEFYCWNLICVPRYGWPPLKLEQLRDTMAQAAAMNLPQSLEKCGEAMGLPGDKLKSKTGKTLIQKLCRPRKPTKGDDRRWIRDADLLDQLETYCAQDVVAEEAIAKKLRPLTEFQQQGWVLTQRINMRGVPIAVDEVPRIVEVVEAEKERLNKELRTLTGRRVTAATKRQDLLDWCNERLTTPVEIDEEPDEEGDDRPGHVDILPENEHVAGDMFVNPLLENMKGKTVEDALARTDLPADVRRALEIRAAVVQTSTAKFAKMLKIAADDGTMKNLFTWHGAGTGRWASRGGMNCQNFARPILGDTDVEAGFSLLPVGHNAFDLLYGDQTMDLMVSMLRGVLKAPDGYEFIDADFSSIENRVGVWLAGQWDKVDMFARGLDEYRTFAGNVLYNVPYDAVTKDMRQMSKACILGSLFGQGWRGLVEYAKTYGVLLSDEKAQEAVRLYREEYARVRSLWYACGRASIDAVNTPGHWFAAGDKLSLCCHRNFLWMKLPSGRLLAWARPRVEERLAPWTDDVVLGTAEDGEPIIDKRPVYRPVVTVESVETKTRKYMRHPLIGSSIFQSGVQGTAADLLLCGVQNTEAAGYPTVLLAHDENMALVPKGWGSVEEFGGLMIQQRPWYSDLPLAYEGWVGERFRK